MLSPNKVKLAKKEESATKGVYELAPLPAGYAHTLGNAFRRVLLSSIMGAAPIKAKIKNATHEFSVIEGVKEDVFNILLNLKKLQIQISSEDFEEVKITLNHKGLGEVTAKEFEFPSNVKILNPDLVICTVTDKNTSFEVELTAKNGYGYLSSEELEQVSDEVGVIFLDSVFSPVVFANYAVSAARLGKNTELDKLTVEIETNGTIAPFEAFKKASATLRDFYTVFAEGSKILLEESPVDEVVEEVVDEKTEKAKEIMVDELNLPTRTINALKKHNINTLNDLAKLDEDRLISVRNLGEKSIEEIKKLLKKEGLNNQEK